MDWRIPSDAGGMRASRAVNENLFTLKITQTFSLYVKNCQYFFRQHALCKKFQKGLCVTWKHAVFSVALPGIWRTYSSPSFSLYDEPFGRYGTPEQENPFFSKN
jgi:hypothetical protein